MQTNMPTRVPTVPGMVAAALAALVLAAVSPRTAVGQTTYTLVSTTSSILWSDTTSWSGGSGSVPGLGDTVLVNAGTTTLNVNTNRSILNLDFSNPAGAVTITTATAATLTITGTLTKSGTAALTFQCLFTNGTPAFSLDIGKLDMTGSGNLNLGTTRPLQGLRVGEMAVNATSNTVVLNSGIASSGTAFIDNLAVNTGRLLTGGGTVEVKSLSGSGTNGRIQASNTSGVAIGTLRIVGESGTSSFGGILAAGNANTNAAARLHLLKTGEGVQVLSGSSNYAGDVTINSGRLEIAPGGSVSGTAGVVTINGSAANFRYNSSIGLNKPITFMQGTLSGSGVIATGVSVGTGAILSPGNSPGSQSFTQGMTLAEGGRYVWEVNNWTGAAGTNYDQLVVSGSALDVTATSGSAFTIAVTGLTSGNAAGAVPNFSGTAGTSFTIATSSAGITGFDKTKFTLDQSGFTNNNTLPTNAGFWLTTNAGSTSLILNYAPSATYNLSAAVSASAIRVGGTSTITASVLSSTASVTSPDQLAYNGLALSGGVGSLSSTSGTLSAGASGSGNVAFTGTAAGQITFTPSLTSGSNVNIGTAANAGSISGVTVSVYNPAAASTLSSPIALGTVLKGTVLSQSLLITNTAAAGSYSEKLDAAFGSLTGAATTNSGSVSLLAAQVTDAASMAVGLSTATAGSKSGSAQVTFASNGQGTSGLAPLALESQTVSLSATVLDAAVASFISGSTATTSLLLDFGSVNQNASVSPLGFDLFNLVQTSGFTADLALIGIVSGTANTGAFTTTLTSTFNNLAAGGSPNAYTASFDTSGLGAFVNTYTYTFKSANAGTVYGSDTTQSLTLTVQGIVVVPEPAGVVLAGIGVGLAGWAAARRRRPVQHS
jgi:autotransporter-associated beta strand protein